MDDVRAFYVRTLRAVGEASADVLADGRAEVVEHESEHGHWFTLVPRATGACELTITLNGPGYGEITLGFGRAGSWTELWGEPHVTLTKLVELVMAVLAGRYDEDVKGGQHVGRVNLVREPFVFSGNVWSQKPWSGSPGWAHLRYDPY